MVAEIEARGRECLRGAGYERYEISAYARPGRRCRHNLNYWQFGDYLGIGAGAHGKTTRLEPATVERRAKTRNPRTYAHAAGTPEAASTELANVPQQVALEFLLNALRLVDGVSDELFAARAGQPVAILDAPRAEAIKRGWLSPERGALRATSAGLEQLNRVLELFA
jgi:oxygen-independent coproporphyrinogen-3 oxidase